MEAGVGIEPKTDTFRAKDAHFYGLVKQYTFTSHPLGIH